MNSDYKPTAYNSVSPYFIVDGAQKLIDLLQQIFGATEMRRYDMPDGTIMHTELKIDDTVIMLGDASPQFPAITQMIHVYVPDVDFTFKKAIDLGCTIEKKPTQLKGDTDKRGTFKDFAGNTWSVATQISQ